MMGKIIKVTGRHEKWLDMYKKMHRLNTLEECLEKLIDTHKAFTKGMFKKVK